MTKTGNLPQICMLNMWSWKRWTWIEKLNTAWFGRLCYASDVPQLERVYYFIYFLPLFNYLIYLQPRLLLISTTRAPYHGENETANEGRLVYSNFSHCIGPENVASFLRFVVVDKFGLRDGGLSSDTRIRFYTTWYRLSNECERKLIGG